MNVNQLETDISNRMSALERTYQRNVGDTNLNTNRILEDLTTTARRGAVDQQQTYDYGLQKNQISLDQAKQAAERERRANLNSLKQYQDARTLSGF
jgi:hypothetical protein